jgi:multiple RNA-binding domain-containing protein 1
LNTYVSETIIFHIIETESHTKCLIKFSLTKQVAQKLGDANLPRPRSRHSTKKYNKVITSHVNNHARAKGHEDNSMEIDDPKLQDFLQVMQPRAMSKLWANDTSVVSNDVNNQATLNKETESTSVANHPILSDSQVDELPKNPKSDKKRELKHDGVISDMDYFKSKLTTEWSDSESSDDDNGDDNSDSASSDDDDKDKHSHTTEHEENRGNNPIERTPRSGAQELDPEDQENTVGKDVANDKSQVNAIEEEGRLSNPEHKKGVSEPCRLFVRNLPYSTT